MKVTLFQEILKSYNLLRFNKHKNNFLAITKKISIILALLFGLGLSVVFFIFNINSNNEKFAIRYKVEARKIKLYTTSTITSHYNNLIKVKLLFDKLSSISTKDTVDLANQIILDNKFTNVFWTNDQFDQIVPLQQKINKKPPKVQEYIISDIKKAMIEDKAVVHHDQASNKDITFIISTNFAGKKGALVGYINIKNKILSMLKRKTSSYKHNIYIFDNTNNKSHLIYTNNNTYTSKEDYIYKNSINSPIRNLKIYDNAKISLSSYQFEIFITPNMRCLYFTDDFYINLDDETCWSSLVILLCNLFIDLLVILFLYHLVNRNSRIQYIVDTRTAELLKSTKELENYKDEISNILLVMIDGFVTLDTKGKIQRVNKATSIILGYEAEELIGETFENFLITEESIDFKLLFNRDLYGLMNNTSKKMRVKAKKKSDDIIIIELGISSTFLSNKTSIVILIRDIDEQVKNEQAISIYNLALENEKNKAELANQAKSQFLANMSHEIRTPMSSIFGAAELLSNTTLNLDQKDLVKDIYTSCDLLLSLINDVLDLSKIESGIIKENKSEFRLDQIINEVVQLLTRRARNNNNRILVRYDPSLSKNFFFDTIKIRQVLINLINNAIKFSKNEVILVSVEPTNDYIDGNNLVLFTVTDNGIGIEQDKIDSIFNIFTQADESSSRKYGGTGLGLAICKKLVEIMGGEIGVSSIPNYGSTFWFKLPLKTGDLQLFNSNKINNCNKILIVDESEINCSIIAGYLSYYNLRYDYALNSEQALKIINHNANNDQYYNFIFISYALETIDWIKLGEAILLINNVKNHSKLILIAEHDYFDIQTFDRQKIFSSYVIHPITPAKLINILCDVDKNLSINNAEFATKDEENLEQYDAKLLVAEDYAPNQKLIKKMLEKYGCKVDIVSGGIDALEAIKDREYDLIFMDCQMPDIDGYETVTRMRAQQNKHHIVVAMTANALIGDREKCIKVGMDDYISKPLKLKDLGVLLKKWL